MYLCDRCHEPSAELIRITLPAHDGVGSVGMSVCPGCEPPKRSCGCYLHVKGIGAYPYDCPAKDKYPNDVVYISGCEHYSYGIGWTHKPAKWAKRREVKPDA